MLSRISIVTALLLLYLSAFGFAEAELSGDAKERRPAGTYRGALMRAPDSPVTLKLKKSGAAAFAANAIPAVCADGSKTTISTFTPLEARLDVHGSFERFRDDIDARDDSQAYFWVRGHVTRRGTASGYVFGFEDPWTTSPDAGTRCTSFGKLEWHARLNRVR